ncbi:type IV secretory system conjugative DNA transfer family protein, partial [Salipiger pacificus]|nr:type IV secretory system conjugative DNA transfer family protein [Alloyangia pacifica]
MVFSADIHGAAKWANWLDLKAAGMLSRGGVYLGETSCLLPRSIYHNGDGHILTVAPPGSGKTTSLVIPNLLLHDEGSIVVTDPKGALTAQTARHRRDTLGQRIVILNPWRAEIAEGLGVDLGDTGFNPLSLLKADDPALIDNAEMISGLLCPCPDSMSEEDKYWPRAAGAILTG